MHLLGGLVEVHTTTERQGSEKKQKSQAHGRTQTHNLLIERNYLCRGGGGLEVEFSPMDTVVPGSIVNVDSFSVFTLILLLLGAFFLFRQHSHGMSGFSLPLISVSPRLVPNILSFFLFKLKKNCTKLKLDLIFLHLIETCGHKKIELLANCRGDNKDEHATSVNHPLPFLKELVT